MEEETPKARGAVEEEAIDVVALTVVAALQVFVNTQAATPPPPPPPAVTVIAESPEPSGTVKALDCGDEFPDGS